MAVFGYLNIVYILSVELQQLKCLEQHGIKHFKRVRMGNRINESYRWVKQLSLGTSISNIVTEILSVDPVTRGCLKMTEIR